MHSYLNHKCDFLAMKLEYFGHIIDEHGIQVDPSKVRVIQEWPRPETIRDLQSFLGLANY